MEFTLTTSFSKNGLNRALHCYLFPEDYGNKNNLILLSIRYIFMYGYQRSNFMRGYTPTRESLIQKCIQFFHKFRQTGDRTSMYEIADILNTFEPNNDINLLDIIREDDDKKNEIYYYQNNRIVNERKINHNRINHNRINHNNYINENENNNTINNNIPIISVKTVYSDSQNVHDSSINSSVIKVLNNLYSRYGKILDTYASNMNISLDNYKKLVIDKIKSFLKSKFSNKSILIDESIDYINRNIAKFGNNEYTLGDAIICLWLYITAHKNRDELQIRLLEELNEMKGFCTTGHIARLMNVIQGYTDDENLCIRISNREQIRSVIQNYLNTELSNCDNDEVMDGFITGNEVFKEFIKTKVNNKLPDWTKEYGNDIVLFRDNIVNTFAGCKIY
jgi:hypothetical protein